MTKITINGTEYEVGFNEAAGKNMARSGADRHLGLRGPKGGYYSVYLMKDGTTSKLVSVGS